MRLPWKRRQTVAAPSETGAPAPVLDVPVAGAESTPPPSQPAVEPVAAAADPLVAAAPVGPSAAPQPVAAPAPILTPAARMAAAAVSSTFAPAETPLAPPAPPVPSAPPAAVPAPAEQPSSDVQAPAPAVPAPVVTGTHAGPPRRRGLIPHWLPWAAGGTLAVIIVGIVLAVVFSRSGIVRVPSLQGMDRKAAATRLQELGLDLVVGDQRFSASAPLGSIIDQTPAAGTQVKDGTVVTVALSAGSEAFAMPDVVGSTLDAARKKLRDRGLTVEFQTVPSDKDQGTVVSSVPSPGVTVLTGDTVRLTVAAGTSGSDTLLPSNLKGKTIVLDSVPMPAGSGTIDPPLDIATRVRALLEAAGARVVMTRELADTGDKGNTLARSKRAKEASGTALVGFTVTQSGAAGLAVQSVPNTSTTRPTYVKSLSLTSALTDALKVKFPNVVSATASDSDTILNTTGVPAVRIRLGSVESAADKLSFTDPLWADNVATAVYRSIAQVYGGR